MRYHEILNEAKVPLEMLAPRYFHGTKKQYVKGVMAHGLQPPDFAAFGTKNSSMRPVQGRVYITPNANDALMYGKYLCVINRESLVADLQPDEDEVGDIYHWVKQKDFRDLDSTRRIHSSSPEHVARMELLNQPEQHQKLQSFVWYMDSVLTPNMKRQIIAGEYAWWAKGGKRALKTMPESIMLWLISLGVHMGHAGPIAPDEIWMVEHPGLLSDGSNLADVAQRLNYDKSTVTPMPPKGPPQKFEVTYQYISNFPHFGGRYGAKPDTLPEPKYKTRKEVITAPSEDEARAEAEIHIERTVPSADYKIIDFKKID